MIKNDLRLFFSAFFITLLLSGWFTAFFLVDTISSQYETSGTTPALGLTQKTELRYELNLLGQEYTLYLDQLNELEHWRKEYACLLTPRTILRLERAYSAGVYGAKKYYDLYKEYQYQQNVAKEQVPIP